MRILVRKHLDALKKRRGIKHDPSLVGFWGANHTLHSGALSQWYMRHTERIELSPYTNPTLAQYWHDGLEVRYHLPSAEHAMMLSKAIVFGAGSVKIGEIIHAPSPASVKALGRGIGGFNGEVWDKVKYPIVRDISYTKFSKGHCLDIAEHYIREAAKTPRGYLYVETSPYDAVWGIKSGDLLPIEKWKGDNLLGFAITEAFDCIATETKPW